MYCHDMIELSHSKRKNLAHKMQVFVGAKFTGSQDVTVQNGKLTAPRIETDKRSNEFWFRNIFPDDYTKRLTLHFNVGGICKIVELN